MIDTKTSADAFFLGWMTITADFEVFTVNSQLSNHFDKESTQICSFVDKVETDWSATKSDVSSAKRLVEPLREVHDGMSLT